MLWALMAIVMAAWTARQVMRMGAATPGRWAGAFAAGYASGLLSALFLLALGYSLAGGGWAADMAAGEALDKAWWVPALGALAGLAGAWYRGEAKVPPSATE